MAITVIAHNNTASSISIDDLGITLLSSDTINLTDLFEYVELTESTDLNDHVSNGDLGINDGTTDLNINDALQHLHFESEYQDLIQDGNISGVVSTDLACCETHEENINVPSSWTNIIYNTTTFSNDTTTIEHNSSNKDRIDIKKNGIYNITIACMTRDNTSNFGECHYRVMKNNTTPLTIEKFQNLYHTEIHSYSDDITRSLVQGDFITFQIRTDDNVDILSADIKVTKLEGVKGDQGSPGGTTVEIEQDNVAITTNTDKINFTGSVNVTDSGSNKATVEILSNSFEPQYINVYDSNGYVDINQNTATPYSWDTQYIRDTGYFDHSTSTNPSRITMIESGLYKVSYVLCYDNTNNNRKTIKCYIRLNGTTEMIRTTASSYTRNNTDDYGSITLPAVLTNFDAGDYIELMYKREGSSGTVHTYAEQCWLQVEYVR